VALAALVALLAGAAVPARAATSCAPAAAPVSAASPNALAQDFALDAVRDVTALHLSLAVSPGDAVQVDVDRAAVDGTPTGAPLVRRSVAAAASPGEVVVSLDTPLRLAAGAYVLVAAPPPGGWLAWSTCASGSGGLFRTDDPLWIPLGADTGFAFAVDAQPPDLQPPLTTIDAAPAARTAADPLEIRFHASEPATSSCALDGAAAAPCTSPLVLAGLVEGPHAVVVASVDRAGNAEPAPPRVAFVVDRTAPALTVHVSAGRAGVHAASYALATDDAGAALVCALDAAAPAPCAASGSLDPGTEGAHVLHVRARDAAGNERTAEAAFTADWTAPTLALPAPPVAAASDARGATVRFAASATDALDPAPMVTCDPSSGSRFPIGATRVACRAVDANGNAATAAFAVTVRGPALPELRLAYDVASGRVRATETGGGTVAARGDELVAARAGHVLRARLERRGGGLVGLRRLCYDRAPCTRPADNRYAVAALVRGGRLRRLVVLAVAGPRTIVARYVPARDVTIVTTFDRSLGGRGVSARVCHGLALPVLESARGAVAVAVP
jgi:hypothetical protein